MQDLDRELARQLGIEGRVHDPHRPGTDALDDDVPPNAPRELARGLAGERVVAERLFVAPQTPIFSGDGPRRQPTTTRGARVRGRECRLSCSCVTTRIASRIGIPEVWIALACASVLVLWALPPLPGVWIAAAVTVVSLTGGAMAGVVYHLRLRDAVVDLPHRWWWNPTAHHGRLDARGRRRVMPWFVMGAAGCGLAIAGAIGFLSAALRL
jgi:hypothetical protein